MAWRWWRIRPSAEGIAIVGEVSPDGLHWQVVGVDPVAPPAAIRVELGMGTYAPEATPSTARFGGVDECP